LAEAAQLTPGKNLTQSTCYLTEENKKKYDWENLPELDATPPDWENFKEALFREYASARKPFVSLADLEALHKRTQSRTFIPLTTMPSSIENLGGWQHIWPRRRKYQTSSSTRPMTAFILTCATGSCSTYMTRSLLMKEVRNLR